MTELALEPYRISGYGAARAGFMLEALPGCYALIGNGGAKGDSSCNNLHNPKYDFNDDIIGLGASYWAQLSRQWFAKK